MTQHEHKARIVEVYQDCLNAKPPVGVNGRVKILRQYIKEAVKEGIDTSIIERWLEECVMPKSGQEQ